MTARVAQSRMKTPPFVGAIVVASAIVANYLVMGTAIIGLNVGLVVCYAIWARLPWGSAPASLRVTVGTGVLVQVLHFGEEYATGFYRAFPRRFGYEWTPTRFVAFNGLWLAVFVVALWGLHQQSQLAYLGVLFLAVVGGIGNGIVHVGLAAQDGVYFPGLYTAPLCLAVGTVILSLLPGAVARSAPSN
jgi:hypothetical protein